MLFDSHAHLYDLWNNEVERKGFMGELENHELLSYVADIGYDLESSKKAVKDAEDYSWCCAVVGVHPHEVSHMTEDILSGIETLALNPNAAAIGEIGLDYFHMHSEKEDQRYWFRRQIQLANKLKMPMVIHSREADQEVMDILIEEGAFSEERKSWFPKRLGPGGKEIEDPRVDIHCFSGSAEFGREYIKLGAILGIDGPITFKNNKKTVRVVEEIPLEYLVIETDSPYLTPVPYRGQKNRPQYVEYVAEKIAELKGMNFDEVARITTETACNFYGIK